VEINPNNPDFHRNLGSALVRKGLMDEAAIQYQEAMRLRRP
jgi:Flp pilus assembly protein TadD